MSESNDNIETEHSAGATPEQKLWVGISLALCFASLCGAQWIEIVHGSTQWQMTFALAFVGYLVAASCIGTQSDLFVEHDDEEEKQ